MIRLLNILSLELREFHEDYVPDYAIASHRWQKDEATYKDVLRKKNLDTPGFEKIEGFCNFLRTWSLVFRLTINWLWIDTCCIDKKSSAELSEAINSMYDWYAEAEICIAYLFDIDGSAKSVNFETSDWFKRGWTLQELIAPSTVVFLDKNWHPIGHKGHFEHQALQSLASSVFHPELNESIAKRTGIAEEVLRGQVDLDSLDVETRLSWIQTRSTTRPEDRAYCLLGIFGVYLPTIYGERAQSQIRLLEEVLRKCMRMREGLESAMVSATSVKDDDAKGIRTSPSDLSPTIELLRSRISGLEIENSNVDNRGSMKRSRNRDFFRDTFTECDRLGRLICVAAEITNDTSRYLKMIREEAQQPGSHSKI